jgi:hypothetical protein
VLVSDGVTWGTAEEGSDAIYQLAVDEPGQLLTVILVGSDEADLDLRVVGYDEDGFETMAGSSFESGSVEIVSQAVAAPGLYQVIVEPYAGGGEYFILTRLEDPRTVAGQWAVDAEATSEYSDGDWSAVQAIGEPDAEAGMDDPLTWVAEEAESGLQTLTLSYEWPVVPYAVNIYENLNPGAVVSVAAYALEDDVWVTLWEGIADTEGMSSAVFSPPLAEADFTTDAIRIELDTDAVSGWNEIDAVELFGRP